MALGALGDALLERYEISHKHSSNCVGFKKGMTYWQRKYGGGRGI